MLQPVPAAVAATCCGCGERLGGRLLAPLRKTLFSPLLREVVGPPLTTSEASRMLERLGALGVHTRMKKGV